MAKFKAQVKDVELFIRVKLSGKDQLVHQELDYIANRPLRGFLRPSYRKTLLGQVIEYRGPMGISISERLARPLSKYDFFFIIAQIIEATRKLMTNNLFMDNLVLTQEEVFINETTKELQFIYLPLVNNVLPSDPLNFMRSIVYAFKTMPEENPEYITRFNMFLNSLGMFNPEAINEYINREDPRIVPLIRKNSIGHSGFMAHDIKAYFDAQNDADQATDILGSDGDDATNLLSQEDEPSYSQQYNRPSNPPQVDDDYEYEATGLLTEDPFTIGELNHIQNNGAQENFSQNNQPGFFAQSYTPPQEDPFSDNPDGTTLLSQGMNEGVKMGKEPVDRSPKLLRLSDNEVVSVNKPVFRIGKEKSYVDYFLGDNSAISRSHADIITRGDTYYISDLNSKNFTFLNGIKLVPNQETILKDGDKIKFADDEFVFLCS